VRAGRGYLLRIPMITGPRAHFLGRCRQRGYTLDEVRACIVSEAGDHITVDETHPAYPAKPKPGFVPPKPAARKPPPGPGTELKALLATIGIVASPTCSCNKMAKKMDEWGPAESLNHIEEIVDVMEETAKKRKLPFLRTAGRTLVRIACWKAKRKGNGK
jgi:hypothetical protein